MDFTYATRTEDNGSRERLAWAVLIASFATWVALLIAIPIGVNSFLQNASRPLMLAVQANEGTVGVFNNRGQRDAIFVGEPERELEGRASILTSMTDTALVSIYSSDGSQVLARLHVYGNTSLDVEKATTPRFNVSSENHELTLNLKGGRLRVNLPEREGRDVVVRLSTPQEGEVVLNKAGEYSLETTNASTSVVVIEGEAAVSASGEELVLQANQRAMIPTEGALRGPLSSERDLVQNGNFSNRFDNWQPWAGRLELQDQMAVAISVINSGGETLLRFHRVGVGHADAELRQVIEQDVTDFQSLELFLTMRIVEQSLGVCGVQGSECPLFVRLVYEDLNGNEIVWQQGFFAIGEFVAGSTPDVCQFCAAPRNPHLRVPLNQLYFFESGNLLEKLAQQNIAPRFIKSISLYASGHTFETQVIDVGLIGNE